MRSLVLWLILFIDTSCQLVYYSKRYDYYDIDFLIENPRLLKGYLMCFISRGPCSPDGKTFKAVLPEVIMHACRKCSVPQKRLARKAFAAMKRYLPQEFEQLLKIYDPHYQYFDNLERTLASI
ncbi:Putative odorant-binding protein A10 [Eumeta japonica]|uniref:Odorant-binding protein A10 n=1 Tax=Eumeta variegata TaxID=151549 RepID=A0A4C1T0X5_EUMVA|nr:Putative odorant-binding protein A10 [Eumeta japonica]